MECGQHVEQRDSASCRFNRMRSEIMIALTSPTEGTTTSTEITAWGRKETDKPLTALSLT